MMQPSPQPSPRRLHTYCLFAPDGFKYCYGEATHVLRRARNTFSTPVCPAHIEAARAAIRGPLELLTVAERLPESGKDGHWIEVFSMP